MTETLTRIVTIGGGGGHAQILKGLGEDEGLQITAITTASDGGGDTDTIAREFKSYGVNGSLGDVGKCLCALSPDRQLAEELLYRFPCGSRKGQSLKNSLFLALICKYGPERALDRMHRLLSIHPRHQVLPVSFERTNLMVRLKSGQILSGEGYIDTLSQNKLWKAEHHQIVDVWLKPKIPAQPAAIRAIEQADFIILGVGDLYTSVIPALLPDGLAQAIKHSSAPVIALINLMTKIGETDGYAASDFVQEMTRRIGDRYPDFIVCNASPIPKNLLRRYHRKEHKVAVVADTLGDIGNQSVLVRADLWTSNEQGHIIHDPVKTAAALKEIMAGEMAGVSSARSTYKVLQARAS